MVALLLTAILTYLFTTFFGYVVHWALHQSWAGRFNQSHMTHHLTLYPPEDYLSDTYRHAGKDNTAFTFALASIPVVILPVGLWFFGAFSFFMMMTSLAMMAALGFLHDYLHNSFHIRNHFLSRIPWFKDIFAKWSDIHYLHHVDMETNYGIFVFHWDKFFGTFWQKF